MKKLTKTQEKVMQTAKRYGRVCITSIGGHGHCGGLLRRSGGRASNAACKLRDMGLLVFVKHEHSTDTKRGWTTHITDAIFELTNKGRAFLGLPIIVGTME